MQDCQDSNKIGPTYHCKLTNNTECIRESGKLCPLQEVRTKAQSKPKRKIIQICSNSLSNDESLFALCNDGSVFGVHDGKWIKIIDIPQD